MPRSSAGVITVSRQTRYRAYDAKAADGSMAEINSHFDGPAGVSTITNEVILSS
jgi:hypothetical protein